MMYTLTLVANLCYNKSYTIHHITLTINLFVVINIFANIFVFKIKSIPLKNKKVGMDELIKNKLLVEQVADVFVRN